MALPKEAFQPLPSHGTKQDLYLIPQPSEVVVEHAESEEITGEELAGYWGKAIDELAEGKPRKIAGAALVTVVEFAKKPSRFIRTVGFFGVEPAEVIVTAIDLAKEMKEK